VSAVDDASEVFVVLDLRVELVDQKCWLISLNRPKQRSGRDV
jgi:hypothetical protein